MSNVVTVNLPYNITPNDLHLFSPYTKYQLEEFKVLYLQEIFITYSGLCVDENGLKAESHHAYPEKYQQLLNEVAYYYDKASNDPSSLITLDDDNIYLLIHHPWSSNYWHWMTEAILRVWSVKQNTKDLILILPDHFKSIEFMRDSLQSFQFKDIYYIPFNKSLLIRNLCLPQIKPICDSYNAKILQEIREHYLSQARSAGIREINVGDKVYISRKKATRRKVINEDEVVHLLNQYGFVCITTEDYTFDEEIQLFCHVRYLISIHGSGLTNMLFMRPGSSVFEMHKRITNQTDWHSFAFWYLADALGLRYFHQVCEPKNPQSTIFDADYIVDVAQLEENVKCMLDLKSGKEEDLQNAIKTVLG